MFNTTSDQSSAYPLFVTLGLLPKALRRKPSNLANLAFLPKFLKRCHRGAGVAKLAHLKRCLVWAAIKIALHDLVVDDKDSPLPAFRCASLLSCCRVVLVCFVTIPIRPLTTFSFQGVYTLFGEAEPRRVFLTPLLYLGGTPPPLPHAPL